jgi:hypothetical protein
MKNRKRRFCAERIKIGKCGYISIQTRQHRSFYAAFVVVWIKKRQIGILYEY